MMLLPMRPKPLMPTLMGITSSDGMSEIAALQERMTTAGEQKMLWVARTKVNARRIGPAIITADEGLVTCVHPALAVRFGTRRLRPSASPLDFPARSRPHLLLGVFLAGVSNSRIDWAARNSARR